MYTLKLRKASSFDEAEHIYESDVLDIVNSISNVIPDVDEDSIERNGNTVLFHSELSEREIKDCLKQVFSHHFDNVRFVSLSEA